MKKVLVPAKRFPRWAGAAALALLAGVAVAVIDPFANRQALNDDQLDSLRGGYESAQGLVFSFGIERAVVVNGELLATTRLVIDNVGALLVGQPGALQVLAEAQSTVPGPTAPSSPAGASSSTAAAQPVASAASQPSSAPTSIVSAFGGTPTGGTAGNNAAATGSYVAGSGALSQAPAPASTGMSGSASAAAPSTSSAAPSAPVAAASLPAPASTVTSAPAAGTGATTVAASAGAPAPVSVPTSSPASGMGATTEAPTTPQATQTASPSLVPGSAGTPAVATAPATTSTATAPQAASQTTPPSSAASSTPALYVQVNAAGTVVLVPNGAALAASVQNSANDVRIQTITQIDAVLSSLSAYRAGVIGDAARQAAFARP